MHSKAVAAIWSAVLLSACASTSSTILPLASNATQRQRVAIVAMQGELGEQAVELISQELGARGIAVVESARTRQVIGIDTDLSSTSPASVEALSSYGTQLGVSYLLTGTVTAQGGPMYSFKHVNLTLRLIDVRSGQTRWIGRYGNSFWSGAISTQGDLQHGAKAIVEEFVKAGGPRILESDPSVLSKG